MGVTLGIRSCDGEEELYESDVDHVTVDVAGRVHSTTTGGGHQSCAFTLELQVGASRYATWDGSEYGSTWSYVNDVQLVPDCGIPILPDEVLAWVRRGRFVHGGRSERQRLVGTGP